MLRKGDCSSWVARACLSVPSKTGSPVVLMNSVRRTESFSVRALVRRAKMRPPAIAAMRMTAAVPAHSPVLLARKGPDVVPEVAVEMLLALADAARACEVDDEAAAG